MRPAALPVLFCTALLCSACAVERDVVPATRADEVIATASSASPESERVSSSSSVASSSPSGPREDLETLRIPILVYHHIRDTSPWHPSTWSWKMSVSPDVFREQMEWLTQRGYETVSLDELTAIFAGERHGPGKPVVITFDDNQMSAYDVAVPILAERGLSATFYLIASRLDDPAFIGRAQIPDLLQKGMRVESHTLSHPMLTNLGRERLDHELAESRRILEEATGMPVTHVAYPLTAHNAFVRERTGAAGYVTGTIMDPRPATSASDPLKLPRIMMTDETDLERVLP